MKRSAGRQGRPGGNEQMDFATQLQEFEQRIDDRERALDEAVAAAEDRGVDDAQDRWAPSPAGWRDEVDRLDAAVFSAVAATPTPGMDAALRRVSRAADHWKLWIGTAAVLAIVGGPRGRGAAVNGLAATVLSSTVVNLVLKPLAGRRRPDRPALQVPIVRQVSVPRSTSFPSGHAAAGAAFATGAASELPLIGVPLGVAAALVAYSRVHTGVHYPADVVAGSVAGTALAQLAVAALAGGHRHRRTRTP